ncbi:MAG: NUDIX hydrolase [Kofleriaceae bacterium]
MTPAVAVGAIVFDPEGRVLLVERATPPGVGQWTVPGGRLEGSETLAQGVAREVREETGLVVEVGPLSCVVERMSDDFHYVILDYLARVIGASSGDGKLVPVAGTDAAAARWVPPEELTKLPLTEGLLVVLERARAQHATWRKRS